MPKVRGGGGEKFARVAAQRGGDYKAGIEDPKGDWATSTKNATANYNDGIQQSIADGRFAKGVAKAGTDKWKRKALEFGVSRYTQGVSSAASEYDVGFEPYRNVLESLQLPPRYPKGDPRNIERVRAVDDALRRKKMGG